MAFAFDVAMRPLKTRELLLLAGVLCPAIGLGGINYAYAAIILKFDRIKNAAPIERIQRMRSPIEVAEDCKAIFENPSPFGGIGDGLL